MNLYEKDIEALMDISEYCQDIVFIKARYGNYFELFSEDVIYHNAIAMCVMQISDLAAQISDEFKAIYNGISWDDIKDIKNLVGLKYGSMDTPKLWEAVEKYVPALHDYIDIAYREYCDKITSDLTQGK